MKRFVASLSGLVLAVTGLAVGALPAAAAETAVTAAATGTTIAGLLVDTRGRPVAGALVSASERNAAARDGYAESDANGRFRLDATGPGTYELSFGETSYRDDAWATTVKVRGVKAGATTNAGRITLRRPTGWGASSICVTVRGAIGSSDYPTAVYLKNSRGTYVDGRSVSFDEETNLRRACFSNIRSGAYRVVVPSTGQSVAIRVGKRAEATATLRMKKPAKRGTIAVRVVDRRGKAASAFYGVSDARGLSAGSGASTENDRVQNLPVGRYTVEVVDPRTEARFSTTVTVRHGRTTTATVRMRTTGGTVVGYVKDSAGPYAARVILKGVGTGTRYETWASGGRYVLRNVVPGRYRVTVVDAPGTFTPAYSYGAYRTAYYKGAKLSSSKIITVRKGAKVRLSAITLRR